jgi:hypothetical protein
MIIEDRSYSFYCHDLNNGKYDILKRKAIALRDFKNHISDTVCRNNTEFMNLSKFEWINHFRTSLDYCNNQDISNAISDVYVMYENKRKAFIHKTETKIQKELKVVKYKKNTSNHKKGDVKSMVMSKKSTRLTAVVTYLTKYYSDNLIDYIMNNSSDNPNIQKFRDDVIYYMNEYGDRLISLVTHKQDRILNKLFKNPIMFTSLSYSSVTEQKMNIINKNNRKTSIYNAYISLSGQPVKGGKIHIPVKYSDKHHGNIKHYHKQPNVKNQINNSYTIVFYDDKIRIILSRKKQINNVVGKTDYYGIDVNVKHNLFCDKHGDTIDYDRNIFNGYVKYLKKLDNKLSRKGNNKLSIKDQKVKNKWSVRIDNMLKTRVNTLVKQAMSKGNNHIVMEDLTHMGKSFSRNDEFDGFKYSRLVRLLNLGNLKNIAYSIGYKHNIQVTFIQAAYTSKGCDGCGHIHDNNRVTQEEFKCVNCGLTANADAHSAKMIEDRLSVDVLRQSLLTEKNSVYTPKKLDRSTIKNILEECYDVNTHKCVIG